MNIAIISPEFPPFTNWGGVATFNKHLSLLLSKMGHRVIVITYKPNTKKDFLIEKNGYSVLYVQFRFESKFLNFIYFNHMSNAIKKSLRKRLNLTMFFLEWNIFVLATFMRYQKKTKIDIIHSHIYHAPTLLISLFYRKTPLILHNQGPSELLYRYERQSLDTKLRIIFENFYLILFPKIIVACSKNVEQYLKQRYKFLTKKIVSIPNFIHIRTILKRTFKTNSLVFMGRLEYRKGIDILIKSFCSLTLKYPKLELFLAGYPSHQWPDSEKNSNFMSFFESMNLSANAKQRIHFIQRIDSEKKRGAFLISHRGIAIFPSRYEPFGFVVIEAMQYGYITVSTTNGGPNEIITDNYNGFLVNPNLHSLTKKIEHILSLNNITKEKIVIRAKKKIHESFSEINAKKHYQSLYNSLVSSV